MDYTTTNYTASAGDVFVASLQNVMANFLLFLPKLLSALLILVVGILLAYFMAGIVRRLVEMTRADRVIEGVGAYAVFKRSGFHFSLSRVLASIAKWFILVATFIAVAGVLDLQQLNAFLNQLLLYIPNILVAVVILTAGFVIGEFVEHIIGGAGTLTAFSQGSRDMVGLIARYSIIALSVAAALIQLRIATSLVQMLFGGLVLALSLAFGLGGREHASRLLDRIAPR